MNGRLPGNNEGFTFQEKLTIASMTRDLIATGRLRDPFLSQAVSEFFSFGDFEPFRDIMCHMPEFIEKIQLLHAELSSEGKSNPFSPFPTLEEAMSFLGTIKIGLVNAYGQPVCLTLDDLLLNLQIYGTPGTGKTVLFYNILRQVLALLLRLQDDRKFNVIIIDPKKDHLSIAREHDFVILSAPEIEYNIFEPLPGYTWLEYLFECIRLFAEENYCHDLSIRTLEDALHNCYQKMPKLNGEPIYPNFTQLLSSVRLIIDEYRAQKINGAQFSDLIYRVTLRVGEFITKQNGNLNVHRGLPLDFWRSRNILITDINQCSTPMFRTFLLNMLSKIYLYYERFNLRGRGARTLVFIDEAYEIFNAEIDKNQYRTNEALKTMLRRGREFGLGFIIAAQEPESITEVLRVNAGTAIVLPVYAQSLRHAKELLGLSDEQTQFMFKLPQKFTGVIRSRKFTRPLLFEMDQHDLAYPAKDFTSEELKQNNKKIAQLRSDLADYNAQAKAITAGAIKKEAEARQETEDKLKNKALTENTSKIIDLLKESPFLTYTDLSKYTGWNAKKLRLTIDEMVKHQILSLPVECVTSKNGSTAKFYPLNESYGPKISARLFRHHYYCHRVKEHLESQGQKAMREYPRGQKEGIDVVSIEEPGGEARITAYEITLSFDNLSQNIDKCKSYNAEKIFIVCEGKIGILNARAQLEKEKYALPDNLEIVPVTKFL